MQDAHDLSLVIDAHVPLITLETYDESRALDLLRRVADKFDLPLFQWTVTEGLKRSNFGLQIETAAEYSEPEKLLEFLKQRAEVGLYVLCDFHPFIEDQPKLVRLMKDFALRNQHNRMAVVLLSYRIKLPPEVARLGASFSMSLPDAEQISSLVREEASNWAKRNNGQKVRTDRATLDRLTGNLQGLTHGEVRQVVRGAIVNDGAITESDLPEVNKAKFRLMDMEGVLHYEYDTSRFAAVGGMNNLKEWLQKREKIFTGEQAENGLDTPKGILLTGIQGGGKSLAAKAVAGRWGIPLLRLDMGNLYNKFYGESEKNLREALSLAEQMSPCVLWLDEMEKGIGSDGNDSGLAKRMLATLLTWMAERTSKVFLVATCNDIAALPPELIRKGRFDELFFVDLPDTETRQEIFRIHLKKRNLDVDSYDLSALAQMSEGFSGAEIEQAVVATLYTAHASDREASQPLLEEELRSVAPLSLVMAEKLAAMRQWAVERGVRMV